MQVLLPLHDNEGRRLPREVFDLVRQEVTGRFGGLTAHARSPAEGLWKDEDTRTVTDDIVVYEVMTGDFDPAWWAEYRKVLEERFRQDVIVVRAWAITQV